ncbi:MAG TPA: thioredoxin [Candidatus Diapherotrites archaeon]|uniref:Thioredoxin n=1 Tax=Candidatus Iainarchaeum sp. TaxID=3101447 RepID=A0A7J4IZU3_9ARCH|nr:thioredoxin [Candidatus Diapherotrites archaeon]
MENVKDVNEGNFEKEVIEASFKAPVLVDFWAQWCGPCRMLGPTLEKLAGEFKGRFTLAKLNVDESPSKSAQYSVMSIPNVKMFRDGKVVDEFVGALPEIAVRQWLDEGLK